MAETSCKYIFLYFGTFYLLFHIFIYVCACGVYVRVCVCIVI